jgi:transcriptional regulator of heat shock response
MPQKTFTEEQKLAALEVWRTQGVSAAARSVGCTRQSIYDWIDQRNLQGQQDREAVYQHKRDILKYNLMEKIYYILGLYKADVQGVFHYQGQLTYYDLERPSASDISHLSRAIETLVNIIRMEEGEPISRIESVDGNILENELVKLANELEAKATGKLTRELPSETDLAIKLRDMEAVVEKPNGRE